jgi:UDP-N-acetylglucosamine 2-epimerase (non-hydrolysing)
MERNHLLPLLDKSNNLMQLEPLSYTGFMNLVLNSRFVITDSGGIQEETSYIGIPCLTLRKNTERPVTVTRGTNQLCELLQLKQKIDEILRGQARRRNEIELWDGRTAERIVDILHDYE